MLQLIYTVIDQLMISIFGQLHILQVHVCFAKTF